MNELHALYCLNAFLSKATDSISLHQGPAGSSIVAYPPQDGSAARIVAVRIVQGRPVRRKIKAPDAPSLLAAIRDAAQWLDWAEQDISAIAAIFDDFAPVQGAA